MRFDLGGAVAQREAAASSIRVVGLGAVEEQVGVEGGFPGAQAIVHGGVTEALGVFYFEIEHVVLGGAGG